MSNYGDERGQGDSFYQKLAPLPYELKKEYGYLDQSELRGTYPSRQEIIPLHNIRVICRIPGIRRAVLQPGNQMLTLTKLPDGVMVTVPEVQMHEMVVFEESPDVTSRN